MSMNKRLSELTPSEWGLIRMEGSGNTVEK